MNRIFYIFRHGQTDWNREERCQGHTDIKLNEQGQLEALGLAEKFTDLHLDVIITSDLLRAYHTAEALASKKNQKLIIDSRLREMSYGKAEGMLYQEAIKVFGTEVWEKLKSFKKENDHISFPEGETRKMARERFHEVLTEIITTSDYKNIAISTHGGALRNILHSFLPEGHPTLPIPNCVIYKLNYRSIDKQFIVDLFPL